MSESRLLSFFDEPDPAVFDLRTSAPGPAGRLPLTEEMLRSGPSGDLFGWTQDAGMGLDPRRLGRKEFLLLSTLGGIRAADGTPIALGYHSGHWEVGLLMEAAARELSERGCVPFAGFCSDPCDGRSQGTAGMFDSLPYRNDAAIVLRRLIRSLPTRRGVIGVATCDKGHPAMMMALAGCSGLPAVLVPGGVMLPAVGAEDTGKVQTLGARFAHGTVTLEEAAEQGCRACGSPGGGCHFLGTAATSQVVGEALGLSLPHSALAPSGQPVWLDGARQAARAVVALEEQGLTVARMLTARSLHNAMVVHAAFGGSTNLLLHVPAVAHAAGLPRPTHADWAAVNRKVPRLVSVLPNGPVHHPTVRVFLAGGVPEVMLHLRRLGLLHLDCLTALGLPLGDVLDAWETSRRRRRFRELLLERDGVLPESVILDPDSARSAGMTGTVAFPVGNLAPQGAVVKSAAIDPAVVDADGVYRRTGPARVFTSERAAVAAIKSRAEDAIRPGDVIVIAGCGPAGTGMEETYQVTSALSHTPIGKHVAVVTDARFSGVSTGACIGHVAPDALAGGPIGKLQDGDVVAIAIDRHAMDGRVDLVGRDGQQHGAAWGEAELARRAPRADLAANPALPDDTRLWAALQEIGGGTAGGCVYDVDAILRVLAAGKKALGALVLCVVVAPASAQRNDVPPGPSDAAPGDLFNPGRLRSTLVVPQTPIERFRSPVVDAHSHAYAKTQEAIADWVALMDRAGVRTSFIHTGATGAELRSLTAQYATAYPGRFVMFAGIAKDRPDAADYGERLRRSLRDDVAHGAAGLGELIDKGSGLARAGDTPVFVDDPRFDALWDEAGRLGVPVFVHIAEPAAFYEAPDETNDLRRSGHWSLYEKGTPGFAALVLKLEHVLERHPQTRFVAVHAFNLANDLAAVSRLLDAHPNVELDFAARMWELGRQPFSARRFFVKHQDRILFGTDNDPSLAMYLAHARQLETEDEWFWSADAEWWRSYGMNLPDEVLEKVYRTNAERLLQGDR